MSASIIAIVHAKGDSKSVPGRNCRKLGDRPLFCHAIGNALCARHVDEVIIDSDSQEILELGVEYGTKPLLRPSSLTTNEITGDDLAYWQAQNYPDSHLILQVTPTSPFLCPESIDRAIALLEEEKVDSVVGVTAEVFYEWENGRPNYFCDNGTIPNSFEMDPVIYEITGLYANKTEAILRTRRRLNLESYLTLYLTRIEGIDINTPEDFQYAEVVWRGLQRKDGVVSSVGESW